MAGHESLRCHGNKSLLLLLPQIADSSAFLLLLLPRIADENEIASVDLLKRIFIMAHMSYVKHELALWPM